MVWNRRDEQARAGSTPGRRPELVFADPHRIAHEPAPSPHGPVEARDLLAQLALLRPRERIVLLLVGEGEQVSQVARILKMPVETAFSRLRLGRKHLAHVPKRWRRLW
ncbi:RNA polymerase sigma factor [Sorangium cellulosum]|uniref:RNA polymerase sigma factor n=1 Tax=Sorangium cellulosum TaxID=56 RepID=UPI0013316AC8|nr:sigma factor-like helix-turn-helix DNA-binding protein [Sorangium cellulosum]